MTQQKEKTNQPPFAILRGGYKYKETLGMRRVTTYCMDIVETKEVLYVLIRADGSGGNIRRINWKDEDLDVFGNFKWPVQMIQDSNGKFYVTDEGEHCVHALVDDGEKGYVAIGQTAEVQESSTKTTKIGEFGSGDGQLDSPSGIAFDSNENLLVVDTGNNRVQKFDKDGNFINSIKNYGEKAFNRPSSVHIDEKGYLFVSNWGNDSVVIFDDKENFIYELIGDATLSKWCKEFLEVNPEQSSWRENAGLLDEEKKFWKPTGIESNEDLIFIADACRHRVQIYQK